MLIKSYNLSQLSAKILEGKTFDAQRNRQLNWAVFSKAIELEIRENINWISTFGIINVSVYLTAYSAYAIKFFFFFFFFFCQEGNK